MIGFLGLVQMHVSADRTFVTELLFAFGALRLTLNPKKKRFSNSTGVLGVSYIILMIWSPKLDLVIVLGPPVFIKP